MKRSLILDAHADTVKEALDDNLSLDNIKYSFNIYDIKEKLPYIQFLASFVHPQYTIKRNEGFKRVNKILDKFYFEYEKYSEYMKVISTRADLKETIEDNKLGVILSVENGSAISGNLNNVDLLYKRGVRVMSITWNDDNELGCGALTLDDIGLTKLGKEYIKRLNEKNILIDVSHLSQKGFLDVVDITSSPVVATHSCVDKLCKHPRNLTDEQIKQIANLNGVVGVCFYSKFLTKEKIATVDNIVDHIEYISNLVGIDYVGLGSDFDGINKEDLPVDIKGVKYVDVIFDKMRKRGFSEQDIQKVASKNFVNILEKTIFKT